MKTYLHICLLILFAFTAEAQTSNDWIDYSKKYYKIKVVKDGVYRINYTTLQLAGIPLGTIKRQDFRIIGRGEELYIHVEGPGSAGSIFAPGDYIEFYGEKNTGWLDTAFYADPAWHANPQVSLFTDTATYFLSWNSATTNRRMEQVTSTNFSGKTPESYFMYESRQDYYDTPFEGQYFIAAGLALYEAEYTEGQGWSGPAFTGTYSVSVPTANAYTGGPLATATTALTGANLQNHVVGVSVAMTGSTVSYNGVVVNKLSYSVNPSNLGASTTTFTFSPQAVNDRNTVGFIAIKYPHTMNLGNASEVHLSVADAAQGDSAYLELTNFNDLGQKAWLVDLTNKRRIAVVDNGSTHEVLIPNSGGMKRCYLYSEGEIKTVSSLVPVGWKGDGWFENYSNLPNDSAYLIVYNKSLRQSSSGDYVAQYISYRSSPTGGDYDVVSADIDELYDQFAFGIRKNPMAIRGFAEYALTWFSRPRYLLLLGKAVSYNSSRSTSSYFDRNLVPTFGWPSSDILLTAGLDGTLYAPAIPTGRVAAVTGDQVGEYLNKVKEFDENQNVYVSNQLIETQLWKKQVLHFAGGSGQSNGTFQSYLKSYENVIEDTSYGGFVHLFSKSTSAPIQITTSDSIENLINSGVSIMTFFGHASGSGFDQNIDNPGEYQNTDGKYPLLIANSCLVGDIHQPDTLSNSEDWVLHPKGTIGFLASVSYGEPAPLHTYTLELYKNLGQKMYGQSLGAAIQQTIKNVETQSNLKKTCLLMTLHGDPAVVLNTHSKPDYAIRIEDVYTMPEIVSSEVDSFDMNIIITNIGKAVNKQIGVEITRKFPSIANAPDTVTVIAINDIYYKDTLTVRFPVDIMNGMGLNYFEIRVDNMNVVDELSELNNDIVYPLLIHTDDIVPVYPYQFAVVPEIMQTLKASTGNPFAPETVYRFQIDTSDAFSPALLEYTTSHAGGVVEWIPSPGSPLESFFSNPAFTDSTVFFWRVRRDSLNPGDSNYIWRESSYQYISGKRGWGQAHFHQFKNDDYNLINYNKPDRTFDFITTPRELRCQSVGSAWGPTQWLSTEYLIDGSLQHASSCGTPAAVIVAVIDPVTLKPLPVLSAPCGTQLKNAGIFQIADSSNQALLESYLLSIPSGYYILAYTFRYSLRQSWKHPTLVNAFQALGWNSITSVGDYYPFIYFVKKGDLSTVKDTVGATPNSTIILTVDLTTNNDFGYITTRNIGPAQQWNSLHWDMKTLNMSDSVRLEVSGINSSGAMVPIAGLESLPPDSSDIYNLESKISASAYQNIKLRVYKGDSLKTAPQLRSWHVLLDDVPESALDPSIFLSFYNDTVDEGEIMSFSTVVQNISEYDMDSLLISFWILDRNRKVFPLPSIRYKPLLKSPDTLLTGLTFSSKGFPGVNSLWVEVNPFNSSSGSYDQLEKYHFNNIAEKQFYVKNDKMNPLVDVTFDGVHILDRDIVSAEPHIVIELKDENRYLALDTNALMRVYLTQEGQNVGQPIPYGNTLRFIPASLPENRARVEFDPGLLNDGFYELRVQATDVSDNESGDLDYMITFEVINKSTITSVMNWPNPFSTATKFVFTLTGSDVPQDFHIRIMTISGRVVREIFADELGPIHIGKNITSYAWDGRDEYGDQLANGVYLYKVDIRLDDEAIELRETNADQYFHKGYGKMYLLR